MKKLIKEGKQLNKKENNSYKKLFHYILYQQNKRNEYLNKNMFNNNNNLIFNEESSMEKPIIVEHFIKNENENELDFIYLDNNVKKSLYYSKKYYNLDYRLRDRIKDNNYFSRNNSLKNSRINLYSLISEIYYKKNFNRGINSIWKKEKDNFVLDNNDNSHNYFFNNKNINEITKKRNKNNKLNLVLLPKRKYNKLSKKVGGIKKNNKREKVSNNESSRKIYQNRHFKFRKGIRIKSSFFEMNDMSQRNRFNKVKKDLNEESNKINNMISEFFKGPLYNKFNKMDRIEDLKLKNLLKRPRSALPL